MRSMEPTGDREEIAENDGEMNLTRQNGMNSREEFASNPFGTTSQNNLSSGIRNIVTFIT